MCVSGGCYTKNYGIDGVALNAFLVRRSRLLQRQ